MLVAHEHQLKGLPSLVCAAGQLLSQGHTIHVLVVGGQPRRNQLTQIDRLGIRDRVHFVGRVEDPVSYYQAADIYVHPTRYDACSLSVLEALASGLPVITTSCNGASELVADGVCGYVLAEGCSAEELCDRIRRLLPEGIRQSMGIRAREVAEQLTLEENYRRIAELYHEVLARKEADGQPSADARRQPELSAA